MSFLEQKKKILAEQQEIQRQKQQNKTYFGYNPKPHFNRPQNYAPPPRAQPSQPSQSSYPPAFPPDSRFSSNY